MAAISKITATTVEKLPKMLELKGLSTEQTLKLVENLYFNPSTPVSDAVKLIAIA